MKWIPTAPEVVKGAISTVAGAALIALALKLWKDVQAKV